MTSNVPSVSVGIKLCGCKGIRTCLICEKMNPIKTKLNCTSKPIFHFCKQCGNKSWSSNYLSHHHHYYHLSNHLSKSQNFENFNSDKYVTISGVYISYDVINPSQEKEIVKQIDSSNWISSQSGRRKQDFGPKVNFKKKKIKLDEFLGLPKYTHSLFEHLKLNHPILKTFIPIEQCNLEYDPKRGSSIDPHLDDDWIWGERLVTLNLVSSTYLILTPIASLQNKLPNCEIWINLPPRSLIVLTCKARYHWNHEIRREHITTRRIAMTFRELTKPFLPKGEFYESIGKNLLNIAQGIK